MGVKRRLASRVAAHGATDDHDTLAYRLSQILIRLNRGDRLEPSALAEEFGVHVRTIQRDLNARMAELPLEVADGRYGLNPAFLGKLTTRDIEHFASMSGVGGLFPSLRHDFLAELLDRSSSTSFIVKGHSYENVGQLGEQFKAIQRATGERRKISFTYSSKGQAKSYASVSPLKLINNKGIWYVAALDGEKLKTFAFTKIRGVTVLETQFIVPDGVESLLDSEESVWLNLKGTTVTFQVSSAVSDYFRRRKLVANQVIEKELDDGGLELSAKVGHVNQIFPIVRYWIPHMRIVDPPELQQELVTELAAYVNSTREDKGGVRR